MNFLLLLPSRFQDEASIVNFGGGLRVSSIRSDFRNLFIRHQHLFAVKESRCSDGQKRYNQASFATLGQCEI